MVKDRMVSMTGFATRRGAALGYDWAWDLRSVNGKGFDLRLRLPDWIEGLEPAVRSAVGGRASRGSGRGRSDGGRSRGIARFLRGGGAAGQHQACRQHQCHIKAFHHQASCT